MPRPFGENRRPSRLRAAPCPAMFAAWPSRIPTPISTPSPMRARSGRPESKRGRRKPTRQPRTVRAGLATKADLDSLETRLEARLDGRLDSLETRFNARLDTRLAALETRLTIRFFAGLIAVGGLIVAAVKLL